MLKASNIAHLSTKPDQVAKAGRLERKPKHLSISLQLCQNQRENKIKRSKLAYWLNYKKAAIPQSPPSFQYCKISIMFDPGCLNYTTYSGISSLAHHNPHINAIFVYLFMQELFVDKIHFFKFFCMSDKPQLNIIGSPKYYHFFSQ